MKSDVVRRCQSRTWGGAVVIELSHTETEIGPGGVADCRVSADVVSASHSHAPHAHTHSCTTISIQILKISIFNLPLKENVSVFFLYLLLLSLVFSVLRQDFVSMGRWLSASVSVSGWPGSSDDRKCRASSFFVFVGVIDWKSNLERNRNNVGNFLLCVCPVIGQSFPTWLIWCHYNGKDWVPTIISAGIEISLEIVVVLRADIGAGGFYHIC